jgi:20S proteasome subunit alpha 6
MNKSNYDNSCLIWSPQGRLYQVEYAMEAVNQGTCLLGLRSKSHVVLCGLKSTMNETLGYHNDKLFSCSNHVGMGISGLNPDGRILHKFMKNECLNYNYIYDANYPVERLVTKIADKSQRKTFGDGKRPYGIGLLISGYDKTGPKLFRTCPSGMYYEYEAHAIGGRSHTANTYLEKHLDQFKQNSLEELVKHSIEAMKKSQDITLTEKNLDIGVVGKDCKFRRLSEEELKQYLSGIEGGNSGSGMVIDS